MGVGRTCAAVVAVATAGGCLTARTDARVRSGGQIGVATAVLHTPDAHSYYPARETPPGDGDASDVRGFVELHAAYGWDRFELRWRPRILAWAPNDFPLAGYPVRSIDPPDYSFFAFEMYFQFLRHRGWAAGIGTDFRSGQVALTRELSPRHAVTATVRLAFIGKEPSGGEQHRSGLLQAQLAHIWSIDADHDLTLYGALLRHIGRGPPVPLRYSNGFEIMPQDRSYVEGYDMLLFGASIDWH